MVAGSARTLLALAWLGAAAAHAEVIASPGGEVTLSTSHGAAGACAEPVAAFARDELAVCRLFFEPLFVAAADGTISPRLAVGPIAWSKDGKTAVIPLQPNVELHDGRELTPQDVAASLARAQHAGRLSAVRIQADVAKHAVIMTLSARRPHLAAELSAPWLAIAARGVGTGPFVRVPTDATASLPEVVVTARRFAGYWRGSARLSQLVLTSPPSPLQEARQYLRGTLWWSHAGTGVATGLPAPDARKHVMPPLASQVSLVVRHTSLDGARIAAFIDPEAVGLALTDAHVLVALPAQATAPVPPVAGARAGVPAGAGPVPLYFDEGSVRLRAIAAKIAWQLRQHGVDVAMMPVPSRAVVVHAAGAHEALVLVETLHCRACAGDDIARSEASSVPLLWHASRLTVRDALGGVAFDGWGMPAWEQLFLHSTPGRVP